MATIANRQALLDQLRKDILQWEGYKPPPAGMQQLAGLGPVEAAFPNGIFPVGSVHELVCANTEQATACSGFVAGLLATVMQGKGACLWIGLSQNLFPPALKAFGIEPDRVIFVNLAKDKDVLWATEEALKCRGLAAVICELREIDFKQSRRLQLAVEKSRVTGFILRNQSNKMQATACAARWSIKPLPGQAPDGLPGLGYPRWQVELLKVRNGQPGKWVLEWAEGRFAQVPQVPVAAERQEELLAG